MYFHFRNLKNNQESTGKLKIEVPHWSAQVRIFDDLLNSVAQFEKVQPDKTSTSGYSSERDLPAGVYQIQITLEGKTESEWAPVRPNRLTKVTTDAWNELAFTSSAPIKQIKNTTVSQVNAVEKISHRLTRENSEGDSGLFFFIRTPEPEKYGKSFFEGLNLYDERETLITDFSESVELNKRQGWLAFNAKLPAGGYILRRGRRGAILRSQVIYLCPNWQTEVFIRAEKYPTLATMSVNMRKLGDSRSTPNTAESAQAILNYLRYKSDIRILLESAAFLKNLNVLLDVEHENPWLGVLAAHAILKSEEEIQTRNEALDESRYEDFAEYSTLLREKLIPFLERTIPMHPDVKALSVWRTSNADQQNSSGIENFSFPFPPMLWLSFRRIYAYSTHFAHLIPVNSLTDCIIDKPLDDSPWTAWSHLNRYPENFAEPEISGTRGAVENTSKSKKQKVFSVKTPTSENLKNNLSFQNTALDSAMQSDEATIISADQQALRQVSVLQTARNLVNEYVETGKIEEIPTNFKFDSDRQIGQMLETVDAKAISSSCNIPLSRVESNLENLKEQGKSLAAPENYSNAPQIAQQPVIETQSGQAILNFAVNSVNQKQTTNNADFSGEKLFENTAVKIEYIFEQLHAAALRLFSAVNVSKSTFKPAEARFANQCAKKLNNFAEEILRQADFIVLTNQSNQIFQFNEAFRYLLLPQVPESVSSDEFSKRKADWEKVLGEISEFNPEIKNPVREKIERRFSVRRTKIEDEKSNLQIYLNIIQDLNTKRINAKNLEEIYFLLSDVTLFTSLFTYATETDKKECIGKLNELISKIEKLMKD